MKNLMILSISIVLILVSCAKEEGCTDILATNYSAKAEKDDGSCTYTSSATNTGTNTSTNTETTAAYYFRATIDGVSVNYEEGVSGYTVLTAYHGDGPADNKWVGQQFGLIRGMDYNTGGFATIVKEFGSSSESCGGYKSMFSEKSYTYGSLNDKVEGVFIYYYDNNATYWASDNGTGNSSGSSFIITSHDEVSGNGYEAITIATFNCTLYDGAGNSKELTNGEIKSISVQCN
ncbi:MAG: hypothetical protein ACI9QD_001226 [Thermoproteota archaeon]|jgi:hypothetical protein